MELIDREKRISLFLKPFISKERSGRMERIVKERQLYSYNKYLDAAEINRIPNQRDPVSPLEPSSPGTPLLHMTEEAQLPDPPSSKLTSTQTSTHPDETILFKRTPKIASSKRSQKYNYKYADSILGAPIQTGKETPFPKTKKPDIMYPYLSYQISKKIHTHPSPKISEKRTLLRFPNNIPCNPNQSATTKEAKTQPLASNA